MNEEELKLRISAAADSYKPFRERASFDGKMDFSRFDSLISGNFCLFSSASDFDFDALEAKLRLIGRCLPAIIRIFEKPLIHLRETEEIVPIEAVRKTGLDSLRHASVHSEIWDGADAASLRPTKLLSKLTEDDYSIYENRVFAFVIDRILAFLDKSYDSISAMVFCGSCLNVNLLDRLNHKNYFLALAMLHAGYEQGFNIAYERAKADLVKIKNLRKQFRSRLHYRAYRLNSGKFFGSEIHMTNILSMHKDYRVLPYILHGLGIMDVKFAGKSAAELRDFYEIYRRFCAVLLLFSLKNWGFAAVDAASCYIFSPSLSFSLDDVRLQLKTVKNDSYFAFVLDFEASKKYRIILYPYGSSSESGKKHFPSADEVHCLYPVRSDDNNGIYVGIESLDSFRRLQQTVFRAFVYASDGKFSACPFCHSNLFVSRDGTFFCENCSTVISDKNCFDTHKPYFSSAVRSYSPSAHDRDLSASASILYSFRNITAMTADGSAICPHCGKIH